MSRICAIILAAGQSRRMGTAKLLLPLVGRPVIVHTVDHVLQGGADRVMVVVSPQGEEIRNALAPRAIDFVVNPDSAGDMLSSVRCGLRVLPRDCCGVLVCPGDSPQIPAEVITRVIDALAGSKRDIIVPVYGGRRGHPILFAGHYRSEILTRYDGIGLRGLLGAHPEAVLDLEVSSPGILEDIDQPEDYARLSGRWTDPDQPR